MKLDDSEAYIWQSVESKKVRTEKSEINHVTEEAERMVDGEIKTEALRSANSGNLNF